MLDGMYSDTGVRKFLIHRDSVNLVSETWKDDAVVFIFKNVFNLTGQI
jgi:hypothetical protein